MLNRRDTRVGKELLGPVVDELTINKAVDSMGLDLFHFLLHFVL